MWLGSPSRKLPRTPAVFDRKTKWRFPEMTGDCRSDWQKNYSSIGEHAELVEKQFLEEEKEGLITRTTLREAMKEYGQHLTLAFTGAMRRVVRTRSGSSTTGPTVFG